MKKFGVTFLLIVVIDQLTKWYTHTSIPLMPHGGIDIFHAFGIDFSLVHITNLGGPWGVLSKMHTPLLICRILLIGVLAVAFFRTKRFPLALVIAGAFSNVLDSFIYGHVVDMFYFILWGYSYPVFNIADMSICIGIGLLVLLSLKRKKAYGAA